MNSAREEVMVVAATQLDFKELAAIAIAVGGVLVTLFTPAMANFVLWLLETRAQDRFAAVLFRVFEKREFAARRKESIMALFTTEIADAREAGEIARANKDRLEGIAQSVQMQGAEMAKLREAVKDVPSIGPTLQKVGDSMAQLGRGMEAINLSVARIDERQKLMWPLIEQRQRQLSPSPRRRSADYDESDRAREDGD